MSSWTITTHGKIPKLHRPIFIEGLPGIGNVGKIAVDFIVDELKAQKLYSFYSPKFPHTVFVNEHNLVELPKVDMYYKAFEDHSKQDFLFLVGDIQPIDEESCHTFCMEIADLLKKFKCQEMVTTGGIGLQHIPDRPRIYCTGNSKELVQKYIQQGGIEKQIYGVVGPIMGVSGLLIGNAARVNIPGVALLAETFAHPLYVGIKGAKELLKILNQRFAFGLDIKRVSEEITKLEEEMMKRAELGKMAGTTATERATYIG